MWGGTLSELADVSRAYRAGMMTMQNLTGAQKNTPFIRASPDISWYLLASLGLFEGEYVGYGCMPYFVRKSILHGTGWDALCFRLSNLIVLIIFVFCFFLFIFFIYLRLQSTFALAKYLDRHYKQHI